jgi:hypothetical protein
MVEICHACIREPYFVGDEAFLPFACCILFSSWCMEDACFPWVVVTTMMVVALPRQPNRLRYPGVLRNSCLITLFFRQKASRR